MSLNWSNHSNLLPLKTNNFIIAAGIPPNHYFVTGIVNITCANNYLPALDKTLAGITPGHLAGSYHMQMSFSLWTGVPLDRKPWRCSGPDSQLSVWLQVDLSLGDCCKVWCWKPTKIKSEHNNISKARNI